MDNNRYEQIKSYIIAGLPNIDKEKFTKEQKIELTSLLNNRAKDAKDYISKIKTEDKHNIPPVVE
jgi:hypothetical protein